MLYRCGAYLHRVCILQYGKARARAKHTNGGVCSRSWRRRRVAGACGGSRAHGVFAETRTRARPLVVCLNVNYTRAQRLVLSRRSSSTRVQRVCGWCVVRYYYRHHRRQRGYRYARFRCRETDNTTGDDCPNRRCCRVGENFFVVDSKLIFRRYYMGRCLLGISQYPPTSSRVVRNCNTIYIYCDE